MIRSDTLAQCHARAFDGEGRAWHADEFAELLASPQVIAAGDGRAFAMARVVADEAEILTVATDPAERRKGLARAALCEVMSEARGRGALQVFLEVASDNSAARALYAAEGFSVAGRRRGYYRRADATVDAVVMVRLL